MSEKTTWTKTHCARMDHGGCTLRLGVSGNRIVAVRGEAEGVLSRGYVCAKAKAMADRLSDPGRLLYPLRRTGERGAGKWKRVPWDAALDEIADRLTEVREMHGARAVAFCQGMPKGLEHFVLIRLANTFGSPNVVAVQDVCHAPREVSGMHTCGFYPVADFHHPSQRIVLWGSNIAATNEEGGICRLLTRQLRAGAELMVVDPRRTLLADKARLWLPLRPGGDSLLALAMLQVIVEENLYDAAFVDQWTVGFDELAAHLRAYSPQTVEKEIGVPAALIREGARFYAGGRPAALAWGNPIEQTARAFDAARALVCLMAVCGNLDVPGGNVHALEPPVLGLGKFVRADLLPNKRRDMLHAHWGTIPRLMTVPPEYFRRAVLTAIPYPVRAAYVQCANPMLSWADSRRTHEALAALDFLAVSEVAMTPTAMMADIVLPAATFPEFDDIGHYGLGHGIVLARPKAVEPPGECRPDVMILNALGKKLCGPDLWSDHWRDLLDAVLAPSGMRFEDFARKGYLKGPERFEKYRDGGVATPSGKVELRLGRAEKFGLPPLPCGHPPDCDPEFPLVLTSAKDPFYLHSSYRWVASLRAKSPVPLARIHPATAGEYGVADGQPVTIETPQGTITQTARLTDSVPRGVVLAAYGWWLAEAEDARSMGNGSIMDWRSANYNILTTADPVGREFGTPNLKGIACRIGPGMVVDDRRELNSL